MKADVASITTRFCILTSSEMHLVQLMPWRRLASIIRLLIAGCAGRAAKNNPERNERSGRDTDATKGLSAGGGWGESFVQRTLVLI
jgi:hypothetical protein